MVFDSERAAAANNSKPCFCHKRTVDRLQSGEREMKKMTHPCFDSYVKDVGADIQLETPTATVFLGARK